MGINDADTPRSMRERVAGIDDTPTERPDDADTPQPTRLRRNVGYQYDFGAGEWAFTCGACGTELYAPTKREMWYSHWVHTHNECLGGW